MKDFIFCLILMCSANFLAAQISENFSDGDFSNNPAWAGDVDNFIVNNGELRLNAPAAGSSFLATAADISGATTWQFYTRLGFNPSVNNQLRVFLSADMADLSGNLNGYCLLVGENGGDNQDVFKFVRVDNGVDTELASFASLGAMGTASQATVVATRDASGNWDFSADFSGDNCTSPELAFSDNTYPTGSHFGVHCKYSSGNVTDFYFDNIYINATPAFSVVDATVVSATAIDLTFSAAPENASANLAANYELFDLGGPFTIAATAEVDDENPNLVHLTFPVAMQSGEEYTLVATGVNDCSGNPIGAENSATFSYFETISAQPFDILINEIMGDINPLPAGDFDGKYIELFNRSDNAIDLENFELSDASNSATLPNYILPAGGFVLIIDNGVEDEFTEFSNLIVLTSLPEPNATSDVISLFNENGNLIDQVDYDNDWFAPDNPDGGVSLERINPNLYCAGADNWRGSQSPDGGTPGDVNSVLETGSDNTAPAFLSYNILDNNTLVLFFDEYLDDIALSNNLYNFSNGIGNPETVVLNENQTALTLTVAAPGFQNNTDYTLDILSGIEDCYGNVFSGTQVAFTFYEIKDAEPFDLLINELYPIPAFLTSPLLPNAEFIELYNRTEFSIRLEGLMLADSGNETPLPQGTILPGNYLILCDAADISLFANYDNVLGIPDFPTLNNSEDEVTISSPVNGIIHQVAYDDDSYQDDDKAEGGWTLELINPDLFCLGAENWRASDADAHGTPGDVNSVLETGEDVTPPVLENIISLGENVVLLEFNEIIDEGNLLPQNFSFDNGASNILTIELQQDQTSIIITTTNPAFVHEQTYNLSSSVGIEDCYGNALSLSQASFTFYNFKQAEAFDLLINEIYPDIDTLLTELPNAKFIEIYNRSGAAILLEDFALGDSGGEDFFPLNAIAPGEHLIVCNTAHKTLLQNYGRVIGLDRFRDPNNDDDVLRLYSNTSLLLDEVAYDKRWFRDTDKDDGGWTLERINPERFCEGRGNWRASENPAGGTPGQTNSVFNFEVDVTPPVLQNAVPPTTNSLWVYFDEPLDETAGDPANFSISPDPGAILSATLQADRKRILIAVNSPGFAEGTEYTLGLNNPLADCYGNQLNNASINFNYYPYTAAERYDVIINEIFGDNKVSLGLPETEFIELYNRSDKTINLENYSLVNISLESESRTDGGPFPFYRLRPDSYVVIYQEDLTNPFKEDVPVLAVPDVPGITNGGATVILRDHEGSNINAALYLESLFSNPSEAEGRTLELKNPDAPCEVLRGNNWAASSALSGGTPGKINSVHAQSVDDSMPDLLRAYPVTETTVRLFFNKALDENFANDHSFYTINNDIGQPTNATLEGPLFHSVLLTLATPLQAATEYTVEVDGSMQDCFGNPISMFDNSSFGLPQAYAKEDIVINEVLFNPETGGSRFIELYNRSEKFLDLDSLNIRKGLEGATAAVGTPYILLPDDYVVLTTDPIDIDNRYFVENPFKMIDFAVPSFDDKTDTVTLYTRNELVLDVLQYDGTYHHDLLDREDGVSLERINPDLPSAQRSNWHSASEKVGYATPTYVNSQYYVGEFTEEPDFINIENVTFSPDDDGFEDFLLVNYKTDKPGYVVNARIYDANGRLVREIAQNELLDLQEGNFKWDGDTSEGLKARFGIYIFYVEFIHPDGDARVFRESCVVGGEF